MRNIGVATSLIWHCRMHALGRVARRLGTSENARSENNCQGTIIAVREDMAHTVRLSVGVLTIVPYRL